MLIIKTERYKPGINRIRGKLNDLDKERSVKFDEGYTIEVSDEEFEQIKRLGWCVISREKEVKEEDNG